MAGIENPDEPTIHRIDEKLFDMVDRPLDAAAQHWRNLASEQPELVLNLLLLAERYRRQGIDPGDASLLATARLYALMTEEARRESYYQILAPLLDLEPKQSGYEETSGTPDNLIEIQPVSDKKSRRRRWRSFPGSIAAFVTVHGVLFSAGRDRVDDVDPQA